MPYPAIDTNLLIRFLTEDVPEQAAAAGALFREIERGEVTVEVPDTVIADAVFVLASPRLYRLPRPEVQALLTPLVQLPHFRVHNRQLLIEALAIFGATSRLDFGDCCIIAHLREAGGTQVYSFDRDFDTVPGITRVEPRVDEGDQPAG